MAAFLAPTFTAPFVGREPFRLSLRVHGDRSQAIRVQPRGGVHESDSPPATPPREELLQFRRRPLRPARRDPDEIMVSGELSDLLANGVLTVLQDPELGRTFYVVGTSHVSPSSADDVRRVMRSVQPDAVVVELCRSRVATMFPPEGEGVEPAAGPSRPRLNVADALASFRKFGPTVPTRPPPLGPARRAGPTRRQAALAALLVGAVQGTAAAASGRSAGGEFRAAAEEALALDAEIILGDRPLEITFRRLVASLSPRQLLALTGAMSKAIASGKAAEGVQGPSDLRVEEAIRSLREWCPPLERVLLAERDTYLVWSLRYSRASLPCRSIVGVVGAGHVPGIVAGWDAPDARRRTELLQIPEPPPATRRLWAALGAASAAATIAPLALALAPLLPVPQL
eukprot:tig00021135_g18947.t1